MVGNLFIILIIFQDGFNKLASRSCCQSVSGTLSIFGLTLVRGHIAIVLKYRVTTVSTCSSLGLLVWYCNKMCTCMYICTF